MTFVSEAPDVVGAMAAAKRQRTAVTVTALTTEDRLVQAQPDGSLQAQLSIVPTRVRQGERWAEIDTTLASTSDGSVAPRVVVVARPTEYEELPRIPRSSS